VLFGDGQRLLVTLVPEQSTPPGTVRKGTIVRLAFRPRGEAWPREGTAFLSWEIARSGGLLPKPRTVSVIIPELSRIGLPSTP